MPHFQTNVLKPDSSQKVGGGVRNKWIRGDIMGPKGQKTLFAALGFSCGIRPVNLIRYMCLCVSVKPILLGRTYRNKWIRNTLQFEEKANKQRCRQNLLTGTRCILHAPSSFLFLSFYALQMIDKYRLCWWCFFFLCVCVCFSWDKWPHHASTDYDQLEPNSKMCDCVAQPTIWWKHWEVESLLMFKVEDDDDEMMMTTMMMIFTQACKRTDAAWNS